MRFEEIRQEVFDRGFNDAGANRVNRWINTAHRKICDREAWDFLVREWTGAAPTTIPDLRAVLSVTAPALNLVVEYEDIRNVRDLDPGLDMSGQPEYWFLRNNVFTVYPKSEQPLNVLHLITPGDMSDGDEPLLPPQYHYVLVDAAVCEAYKDTDNFDAYSMLRAVVEEDLTEMRNVLLRPNFDNPPSVSSSFGASTDW